ncbi:MAG: hypothetical protein LQ340_007191 [Diploschistes diacapsis]|nr:MAG: hypothetical protein LQ340_007191 [Diploschistes diacapsis]
MAHMLSLVSESHPPSNPKSPDLLPVFITCDPARDTPAVLKSYLREFHPGLIGLTGTWEQIKAVCKLYRVYFSTPQGVKPGMDYLVDHSIYFYLMDPEGDFVEAIGRQHTAEQGAKIISDHMGDWKGRIVKGQDAEEPYNNNVLYIPAQPSLLRFFRRLPDSKAQMAQAEEDIKYTVFIKLPFPRGDFVDPPTVRSSLFYSNENARIIA